MVPSIDQSAAANERSNDLLSTDPLHCAGGAPSASLLAALTPRLSTTNPVTAPVPVVAVGIAVAGGGLAVGAGAEVLVTAGCGVGVGALPLSFPQPAATKAPARTVQTQMRANDAR